MKYWILSLLTLLTSNYLHANDNNVIEIVLKLFLTVVWLICRNHLFSNA